MRRLDSLIMAAVTATRVPAGKALAVDRGEFAAYITRVLTAEPRIEIIREEVEAPDPEATSIIATGPLTSEPLAESIAGLTGKEQLHFYDAIAPIVAAESIDMGKVFRASRYGAGDDYLNCPFSEAEYTAFYEALTSAEQVPLKAFEEPRYFEGCLPVEIMAARGYQTLLFGPMKPVGLVDPKTGRQPFAVVQLRAENREGTLYNLVGFQTKLKYGAQERVFRLIPGLEQAEFVRLGSIHRNTFIHSPGILSAYLNFLHYPQVFLAGQISGVEGYVESAAMGLLAGINAARQLMSRPLITPPRETASGGRHRHLTNTATKDFQPMNVNFGLFSAVRRAHPQETPGRSLREEGLGGVGGVDARELGLEQPKSIS